MPTPSVEFPQAIAGEWTAFNKRSLHGLYAYRHMQAIGLLDFPDFGGGDIDAGQRREALGMAASAKLPLAALSVFLGVVALEDFLRDLAIRLSDDSVILKYFPRVRQMAPRRIPRSTSDSHKRHQQEVVDNLQFEAINDTFEKAIGIKPVPQEEFDRLRDLSLVRHTVAHHAAVVRECDVPRFQYYLVKPGLTLNPPLEFVRETLMYLYSIRGRVEDAIIRQVFEAVLPRLAHDWAQAPPKELLHLIEFFGYFGFIESSNGPIRLQDMDANYQARVDDEEKRIEARLVERCIERLKEFRSGAPTS